MYILCVCTRLNSETRSNIKTFIRFLHEIRENGMHVKYRSPPLQWRDRRAHTTASEIKARGALTVILEVSRHEERIIISFPRNTFDMITL